jgi:membrane protein YdbS with pleckstrin-like domain
MKKEVTYKGMGLGTILFIIFLVLKLAEIGTVATWSWWWVTAPLWIPLAFGVSIFLILFIVGIFIAVKK